MKRMKMALITVFLLSFTLLALNINKAVAETTSTANQSLPPFAEAYLEYQGGQAHLTSTQMDQMRTLWINQLDKNQEAYLSTNRGTTNNEATNSMYSNQASYMLELVKTETNAHGQTPDYMNAFGQPDGNYAELYTPTYNGSTANIVGEMSAYNSGGQIDVWGALTQSGYNYHQSHNSHWGNYVVLEVDNTWDDSMSGWMSGFVGFAQITSTNEEEYYIGVSSLSSFKFLTVGCVVMDGNTPPNPLPNNWDQFNDVYIDAVTSTSGSPPAELSVPSVTGGTTNVYYQFGNYQPVSLGSSGAFLVTQGQTIHVDAQPSYGYILNNWNLDGNNAGSSNPFSITMGDSHYLQPVFEDPDNFYLSINCYDDSGQTVNANIYVDDQWIGIGSASVDLSVGWHSIAVDGCVWDDYYQTYVYPSSYPTSINLGSDTTINIGYTY